MALPAIEVRFTADTTGAEVAFGKITKAQDAAAAASREFASDIAKLDAALASGLTSQKQHAAAVKEAQQNFERAAQKAAKYAGASANIVNVNRNFASSMAGSASQTANLGAQLNDIGVMLAAGQNPLQLAVQQGTQINQVFAQMGGGRQALRGLAAGFMSMINPMSLATIGIIAGGAALVQWGVSAIKATNDGEGFEKKLKEVAEAQAALSNEIRGFALGASAEELTLLDAVAAKRQEIAELQRKITPQTRIQIGQEREALQVLLDQLDTQRQLEAQKDRLETSTRATADAERMLGDQMMLTGDQIQENERIAELLKQGISASVIEAMQLAGVDMASPISAAKMEAADLATNLNIAYGEAVKLRAARNAPYVSSGRGGDPRGFDSENRFSDVFIPSAGAVAGAAAMMRTPRKGRRGGRGKKGSENTALAGLVDQLQTERELLEEWRVEGLELLQEANAQELEVLGGFNEAKLRLEKEYQERLKDIRDQAQDGALISTLSAGEKILQAVGQTNDKALKAAQSFGAAISLINAYQAASETLKDPTLPWYARISAAASVLAAGIGFVNSIKSVSASGGGGGAGGGGNAGAATAAPQPLEARVTGLNPSDLFTGGAITSLFDRLQDEAGDRGLRVSFAQ